jgi:hypothetical protein
MCASRAKPQLSLKSRTGSCNLVVFFGKNPPAGKQISNLVYSTVYKFSGDLNIMKVNVLNIDNEVINKSFPAITGKQLCWILNQFLR